MLPSYSFGEDGKKRPMRVARPIHNGRMPVAIGSSVPRCPTRLVFSSFLTRCTTSWEVMPPGLSMMRIPSIGRRGGEWKGVEFVIVHRSYVICHLRMRFARHL